MTSCPTNAVTVSSRRDDVPETPPPRRPTGWQQVGGLAGLAYSSVPSVTFVLVNSMAGLKTGIGAAVGAGIALAVTRWIRKQPLRPALSGFVGVAISSFIAYRTGSAKDYFLPDIWLSLACFAALTLSIAIRRPLVGVAWSALNRAPPAWRYDRRSRRRFDLASATLAAGFGARFVVQHWLYQHDLPGWMAFAKIAMNYPLWALALVVIVWAVRRSDDSHQTAERNDRRPHGLLRVRTRRTRRRPGRR